MPYWILNVRITKSVPIYQLGYRDATQQKIKFHYHDDICLYCRSFLLDSWTCPKSYNKGGFKRTVQLIFDFVWLIWIPPRAYSRTQYVFRMRNFNSLFFWFYDPHEWTDFQSVVNASELVFLRSTKSILITKLYIAR